ncbi:hypothetical protein POPTR_007G085550v4 [Populus trichocarpa]|uniref:Uncharacterized protein n=1 Tax=Populus trichocarpa TaxID=3694 RepID=A0ACC0SQC0_POPTR|nr:hypothetical protein POPTR_007G085550v4 [Populus trichocarpa]
MELPYSLHLLLLLLKGIQLTEIDAGQLGINVPIPVPPPFFSFTGRV